MSLTKTELGLTGFHVSGCKLVANVVYEAIICKSYPTLPRKVDTIVEKVTAVYESEFERVSRDFYYRWFASYDDLYNWLKENILPIPEIQELNLSQNEYEAGIPVDSPERARYHFTSSYSPAILECDDFTDLDAFIRNLAHDLMRENIKINYSTF